MTSSQSNRLAHLPSVDRILRTERTYDLIEAYGRTEVTKAIRNALEEHRHTIRSGAINLEAAPDTLDVILRNVTTILSIHARPSLHPVINLTGTVLHTNLGRAFLPEEAIKAVIDVASSASNLEYSTAEGQRGDRDTHLEGQICQLTGAEAATVVNNNAAAVMLVLNTLALGREVPVSRGELVEIGGAFRIPDIMARSGCTLIEVGTTNRTHLADFERAIGPDTAMLMKVHTSNYVIEGFTSKVPESDLANLCQTHAIPLVNDLGSGTLVNLEDYDLPHEQTPMDALKNGADIVTFSGDKLLGGPQAGLIVGRKSLIAQIKANPMKRALRCDKMTIAALAAVLRLYANPDRLQESLPVLRALTRQPDDIQAQAQRLISHLTNALQGFAEVTAIECESQIGSGALPSKTLASAGLRIRPTRSDIGAGTALQNLATAFRNLDKPVIGRINDGTLILDLRCLDDEMSFIEQLAQLNLSPDLNPDLRP